MIAEFCINLASRMFPLVPVLDLPEGFESALTLISSLVGYINIFVPLTRIAPIVGLIVMIRNFNIVVAVFRFVLRFIPFVG